VHSARGRDIDKTALHRRAGRAKTNADKVDQAPALRVQGWKEGRMVGKPSGGGYPAYEQGWKGKVTLFGEVTDGHPARRRGGRIERFLKTLNYKSALRVQGWKAFAPLVQWASVGCPVMNRACCLLRRQHCILKSWSS